MEMGFPYAPGPNQAQCLCGGRRTAYPGQRRSARWPWFFFV